MIMQNGRDESQLGTKIASVLLSSPHPLTRRELACRCGVSKTGALLTELATLVKSGAVLQSTGKASRGQQALLYEVVQGNAFTDKQARSIRTRPCPVCGHWRRLRRVYGSYDLLYCCERLTVYPAK